MIKQSEKLAELDLKLKDKSRLWIDYIILRGASILVVSLDRPED